MSAPLFDEPEAETNGRDIVVPDTVGSLSELFLHRYVLLAHQRPLARKELAELLAFAEREAMSETCRNAGCQEMR